MKGKAIMEEDEEEFSKEIEKRIQIMMEKEKMLDDGSVSGTIGGVRPEGVPQDDENVKIVDFKRSEKDYNFIIAYNAKVKQSGVINHYVFNNKIGDYECVGITFLDGQYVHLSDEIGQESVLISTEYSETSTPKSEK